jgi:AcrR family transcriptional regulator
MSTGTTITKDQISPDQISPEPAGPEPVSPGLADAETVDTRENDGGARRRRRRNPRGEGDRLRLDLLGAAVALMAESGDVEKVSLRAVAQRAGVSPTAVYRHFDDRDSLLRAAVTYCWIEFSDALAAADDATDDPYERLQLAGAAYIEFAVERHGEYTVLFSNQVDISDHADEPPGTTAFTRLVGQVAAILQRNDDDRDPFFVAVQVHSWIHGIVELTSRHSAVEWPTTGALLDDLVLRLGLTAP